MYNNLQSHITIRLLNQMRHISIISLCICTMYIQIENNKSVSSIIIKSAFRYILYLYKVGMLSHYVMSILVQVQKDLEDHIIIFHYAVLNLKYFAAHLVYQLEFVHSVTTTCRWCIFFHLSSAVFDLRPNINLTKIINRN